MEHKPKAPKQNIFTDRYQREFIEVACPICNERRIICVPEESVPQCARCKTGMVIKEVLTEGKY